MQVIDKQAREQHDEKPTTTKPEGYVDPRVRLKLPLEERNRLMIASMEASASEDIELFEAFDEDDLDDDTETNSARRGVASQV